MANTDIKWFSFDNTNAPQLTNTWGCLIEVLDACLVTGFGSQLVSNITILDGVGTAIFGSNHNFKQFQVIEFNGSTIPELNKEFKILGITSNKIEFVVNLPDQTITETISAKLASLGWTKAFTGTQKAVYQAKDKIANPYFLRVDNSRDPVYTDAYAKYAKVGILDSCNGVDDFGGKQVPFDSSNPNKNWIGTGSGASAFNGWAKWYQAISDYASSSQISESISPTMLFGEWTLIGDNSSFYLISTPIDKGNSTYDKVVSTYVYGFGVSEKKGFRVPFLLAHNRDVSANYSEFFFNSNPLRYGWSPNTITMTTNSGTYSQDLQAYPQYYLPSKATDQTIMRSGYLVFTSPEAGIYFSKIMLHSSYNSYMGAYPLLYSMQTSSSGYGDLHVFVEESECFLLKKVAQANNEGAFIFKVGDL
ncbi:hypothetical protein ACG9X6_13965 [Acinetobacter guillouiae]|uniref:hypothetical protein n=1 Tax=Acinetobacter guillouiae TaxID=106649 RepID=UPI003AF585AD